jgi:hypothetical protein
VAVETKVSKKSKAVSSKKKPAAKKPRAKKAAPKKAKKAVAKPVEVVADNEYGRTSLFGEIFWEYRAKMAEYEKSLLEFKIKDKALREEKLDPKYKELLEMIEDKEQLTEELKKYARLLRGVQVKVAGKLNVDIETFLKECIIDHETGIVTILD